MTADSSPSAITSGPTNASAQQKPTDGLVLHLGPADLKVKQFGDAKIDIALTNMTADERELHGSGIAERDFRFDVRDSQGQPVPMTRYGEHLTGTDGRPVTFFGYPGFGIGPESTVDALIYINALFDISMPGDYTVTASLKVPDHNGVGTVELVSNTIKVHVDDNDDLYGKSAFKSR